MRVSGLAAPFLVLVLSLGISNAWTLQQGYSVQYALNVSVPSTIAIGYNVSNIAVLSVMSSSQYGSYLNGSSVYPLYNSTVSGQDIKTISLPAGSYYAILDAKYATINYSYSAFAAPAGSIQSILVNTKYSLPLDLQNYSDINLSFVSDHPLKVYLPGGYNYTINGSVLYWNFHENRGQNYINFTSLQATRVFLLLNATPAIIDPLRYNMTNFTNPQPIGIASYGLYNYSGQFTPYQINTTEIEGTANITEISAYNAMPPVNVSKYGASLQLNALMNIESNGKRYTYWLQNIMSLNTSNMSYYIYDNVWNYSGSRANISNSTLSGNGWISSTSVIDNGGAVYEQEFYGSPIHARLYTYPLYFSPIIKIGYKLGNPIVSFGYYSALGTYYYDNVSFNIPSDNAYILMTPYYETPSGNLYDIEFVFGGENSGEITNFGQLNATIQAYYYDNGTMKPLQSVYTFGSDTAEAATNLRTLPSPRGALVTTGTPNYTRILYSQNRITVSTTTTMSSTVPTTSLSVNQTTVPTYSTTTIPQNNPSSNDLLIGIVALVVIGGFAIAVIYLVLRGMISAAKKGKGGRRGMKIQ